MAPPSVLISIMVVYISRVSSQKGVSTYLRNRRYLVRQLKIMYVMPEGRNTDAALHRDTDRAHEHWNKHKNLFSCKSAILLIRPHGMMRSISCLLGFCTTFASSLFRVLARAGLMLFQIKFTVGYIIWWRSWLMPVKNRLLFHLGLIIMLKMADHDGL
jgi:hypothetical protein